MHSFRPRFDPQERWWVWSQAGRGGRRSQSSLVRQLEPNRSPGLPLPNGCTIHRIATRRHVVDPNRDNVAATQLAVDRQIEQCEVAFTALHLQFGPDRPDMARPQGWLSTNHLPLVPRDTAQKPFTGSRMVIVHGL